MREFELSLIMAQMREIMLKFNSLVCDSNLMNDAGRQYGFDLVKRKSKSGFVYAVR